MIRLLPLLLLTGCETLAGLQPIRTEVEIDGDPRAIRYALTGEVDAAAPADLGPVSFRYKTSADKSLGFQLDAGADGSLFVDLNSSSDSQWAGNARLRGEDRLQAQSEAFLSVLGALAGRLVAAPASVVLSAPVPVPVPVVDPASESEEEDG